MKVGKRDGWKFVEDPCDTGNPLITEFRNGQRIHRNPGNDPSRAEAQIIARLEHGMEITEAMVAEVLKLRVW